MVRVGVSYADNIAAIGTDSVDIAYMGPASYVRMAGRYGTKPLLARQVINGDPMLHGEIIVRQDSAVLARSLLTARGIVSGLSPLVADKGNLAAGLARLAAASSTAKVQVQLADTTNGSVAIPLEDRGQLFRIAQEAVQ